MSLARCTFELEVHEVELPEESEEKERKVAAQRRVAQSRVVLRVTKDMWWRMGTWWLWKAELAQELARACASLREACARFCPWFAKIICSPVFRHLPSWNYQKPCAKTLRKTLRCLAVLLHLVGGPLLKENVRHANGTQMSGWSFFCLLYLFGKCPYIHIPPTAKVLANMSCGLYFPMETQRHDPPTRHGPCNTALPTGTLAIKRTFSYLQRASFGSTSPWKTLTANTAAKPVSLNFVFITAGSSSTQWHRTHCSTMFPFISAWPCNAALPNGTLAIRCTFFLSTKSIFWQHFTMENADGKTLPQSLCPWTSFLSPLK